MKRFVEFFIRRSLLVNIIAVAIVLAGLFFMLTIRRVAFPEVRFDVAFIVAPYPGASPLEVERNVTRPIEEAVKGTSGIKEMYSNSRRGTCQIYIELEPDLDEPESAINDIRQAVDSVQDLPELAENPVVIRFGSNFFPALNVNLSTEGPAEDIYGMADELEQRLLKIGGVSSVNFNGYHNPEIKVDVSPVKLKEYHLSVREIANALRTHVISYPSGTLDEGDTQVLVSLNSRIRTADDIRNIVIRANYKGYTVKVGDVARVYAGREDSAYLFRTNGRQSVNLQIMKMKTGDNINISRRVREICAEFRAEKAELGIIVRTDFVDDVSDFIKNRLDVVRLNALIGLILVIISLFVFLNWRVALFTAAGLPVAFGMTFIIMGYGDITINMMSMVGMIIVLGMLVDDAIIVAENIYRHMEKGEERLRAVVEGTSEVITPVTGTVLTTIAAFVPIFLISGIMGKFLIHMPIIVIAALAASLFEAAIILPVHAYDFARVSEREMDQARGFEASAFHRFKDWYRSFLDGALKNRYLVASIAVLALVILIGAFFIVQIPKFEMFPTEGIEIFFVKYRLPEGTRKEKTLESVQALEKTILEEIKPEELKNFVVRIGSDETHSYISNVGEEYGIAIVYLTDISDRDRKVGDIIAGVEIRLEELKQKGVFEDFAFEKVKPGPPQGKAVEVRVISEDFQESEALGTELADFLKSLEGIKQVETSFGRRYEELEVVVDSEAARQAELGALEVAEFLRAAFEGIEAASIREAEREIEVRVRLTEGWAGAREAIKTIQIENRRGNLVALGAIASIKSRMVKQAVSHKDGDRFVTVYADIDAALIKPREIANRLKESFQDIKADYPSCTLEIAGEVEQSEEFILDVGKSLIIAVGLIFIILTSIFNSPFHPFLVLAAIPFGFGGVVLAFFMHGEQFTMIALIGVIGMSGVVVNDAIVLVAYIKSLRDKGQGKMEAILEGGVTRLRPVVLTSITTLLGLAPTAYRIGGKDPFLPVIALAIGWGLLFATLVTLVLIPCFYAIGDDVHRKVRRRKGSSEARDWRS